MKKYGIFDILGPIMIGPSSSHTAGANRIGQVARQMIKDEVVLAEVTLFSSFAKTGKGHGTDSAIIGGLIGGGWALLQGKSFGEVATATIGGAIDGAITATGIGLMGKIATGVIGGGLGNAVEQGINVATDNQSSINSTELVVSSMFGAIGGRASHQIDDVASKMIQTVDEKYATSATKNAIMKEVKSEMIEKGRELGHSTKQTINEMTKQRINVLSNMDKIFIKGGANTIDGGIGITNTIVNTEIMNWIDKKE